MHYNIEVATTRSVRGWCVGQQKLVEVRCVQAGSLLGCSAEVSTRSDVESAYPDRTHACKSGFSVALRDGVDGTSKCRIEFAFADGSVEASDEFVLEPPNPQIELPAELRIADDDATRYLLFLRSMRSKFTFIERHFPKHNEAVASGSKDEFCVGSSPTEMMHIADQIYRLRRSGLDGPVCEFGCFKGFSTACLSHVCFDLGLRLEVFDSFAGLPANDSDYYEPGEFCGSLQEVTDNVSRFGRIEPVTFHEGFFRDSLAGLTVNPMLIWMDVDLQSSSRDVTTLFDQLPQGSCVLSHECFAENFRDGRALPSGGSGDVITPIVEALEGLGWPVEGRWLVGCLGAFWDRARGLEPLTHEALMGAVRLACENGPRRGTHGDLS